MGFISYYLCCVLWVWVLLEVIIKESSCFSYLQRQSDPFEGDSRYLAEEVVNSDQIGKPADIFR